MAFQFLCPQGHLLQADESLAGSQCQCPYCRMLFIIPGAIVQAAVPIVYAAVRQPEPAPPEEPPEEETVESYPQINTSLDFRAGSKKTSVEVPVDQLPASKHQETLHIPCPNGHVLETPQDMLGQDVMCPFCQEEFYLQIEDSQEYKAEQQAKREQKERRTAVSWLNWSIAAAVVVLGTLFTLIVLGRKH